MRTSLLLKIATVFFIINSIPLLARFGGGPKQPLKGKGIVGAGKTTRVPQATRSEHGNIPLSIEEATREEQTGPAPPQAPVAMPTLVDKEDVVIVRDLLKHYSPDRKHRACDTLPSNVSINEDDNTKIGTIREWHNANLSDARRQQSKVAYVLMVSNHKYIDGALVMGSSLREHSELVVKGEALLMILVTEKIRVESLQQLAMVFDIVKVMRSMDSFSPASYYKTTFDKMYLWWLTEFDRVIFFDADSLALGNTDGLFKKLPAKTDFFVTAVGGTTYFQTALLVVKPDRKIFTDIFLEYRYGPFNYNQWRARDGILLRNCFMKHHKNIGHPKEIFHFYGYIKPWFNKDIVHKRAKDKLVFDNRYHEWWLRYEDLHNRFFAPMALEKTDSSETKYGNSALTDKIAVLGLRKPVKKPVDPRKYMWLQRYSIGSEYLRPTFAHYAAIRDVRPAGMRVVKAAKEENCDKTCSHLEGGQFHCLNAALQYTTVNGCEALQKNFGCKACHEVSTTQSAPLILDGGECRSNFLHEKAALPLCNATMISDDAHRVCACIPLG